MEVESIQDLVGFIQEQEVSDQEESLVEKLERQKRLLLKKQELDDWRKIVEATKTFSEHQALNVRQLLDRANATKSLCREIDQLKVEVQNVIDRSLEQMLDSAHEQSRRFHLKEEHREKKRLQISELRRQLERHEEIAKHIRESKGQAMLREAKAVADEEARKLENVRGERDKLWRALGEKEAGEWEESKAGFVEVGIMWGKVKMQELESEGIERNNGTLRAEIVRITEELEKQRIFEEEEAKRQEEESSQRALTPIRINHPDMGMFKDPNDFPALTTKIEASRRSYEHIFKRPEYVELRKLKHDKRVKLRKQSVIALHKLKDAGVKKQLAVVVPKLKIVAQPKVAEVVQATVSDVGTKPPKMVEDPSPRKSASIVEDREIVQAKPKLPKCKPQKKPSKQEPPPVGRRQKLKPERLQFKERPFPSEEISVPSNRRVKSLELTIGNVESMEKAAKRSSKLSQPNPEQPKPKERPFPSEDISVPSKRRVKSLELTIENVESMESAAKRSRKLSQPNPEQPKPKKVQLPMEQDPPAPPSPTPSIPEPDQDQPMSSDPPSSPVGQPASPLEKTDADSNSGSSSPPDRRAAYQDGVSLGGSISSLELTDRDSASELGFELSPMGSFDGKRADSSPDFDFLGENSPKPRASGGSQQKKAAPQSGGFDFDCGGGGDGGDAFDFF